LGDNDSPVLQGWRYSMVGKELQGFLQGKFTLKLDLDEIILTDKV